VQHAPLGFALVGLLGFALQTTPAFASDIGPAADLREIRHDLPLLLAAPLEPTRLRPTIDWVVADGAHAVAMWHAGKNQGIVALRWRSGQWWWRGAAATTGYPFGWTRMSIPGNEVTDCDALGDRPSAGDLLVEGFIDRAFADVLSHRLQRTADSTVGKTLRLCDPDPAFVESGNDAGYAATFSYKENYYYYWWLSLSGRTPIRTRATVTPGARSLYTFALRAQPKPSSYYQPRHSPATPLPAAITFRDSTLQVWFPYVLSDRTRYFLTLDGEASQLRDLPARLSNNVLYFRLSRFTWRIRDVARGKIEVRSPPHAER